MEEYVSLKEHHAKDVDVAPATYALNRRNELAEHIFPGFKSKYDKSATNPDAPTKESMNAIAAFVHLENLLGEQGKLPIIPLGLAGKPDMWQYTYKSNKTPIGEDHFATATLPMKAKDLHGEQEIGALTVSYYSETYNPQPGIHLGATELKNENFVPESIGMKLYIAPGSLSQEKVHIVGANEPHEEVRIEYYRDGVFSVRYQGNTVDVHQGFERLFQREAQTA